MIPEIGQMALVTALAISVILAIVPLAGSFSGNARWISLARPAAQAQFLFMAVSFGCLVYSFVVSDFSVTYVAANSNTKLPTFYKVSAVWGAHEGSLLLWGLILSVWTVLVSMLTRQIPRVMVARVLSVMGMVAVGFLLFTILTSNPFDRLPFPPAEGRDLNPLLQDFGLIIHPPMLYMGYVGFSVAFAFAIAALMGGKLDAAWARWSRPWTNIAWVFLTLGIALGSWWAYYELGWGGWWFWDPVENASLMPWFVGTALIHSLAVTEKRGSFKSWTVLLAIFAFSLSLLGTFLVRSGVLTSVHSFASDPERGLFILGFLLVVVGGSLLLYSMRAPKLVPASKFELLSRETGLLMNNVVLVVMAGTVLLGTLYPLIVDALGLGKISVGPPYFNKVIVPLAIPLSAVMGIGIFLRWKHDKTARLAKVLWVPAMLTLLAGVILPLLILPEFSGLAVLGLVMASWIAFTSLVWLFKQKRSPFKLPGGSWGMVLAHIGMAITITGVTLTSIYNVEKDVRMVPGEVFEIGQYDFLFNGVNESHGPNYTAYRGNITATLDGKFIATMEPEKRTYLVQTMPMTEAAIDAGLFRDLFVALGEPLGQNAWALRIQYKPFVRWIWLGAIFMGIGGVMAAFDKRYRRIRVKKSAAEAGA